MDELWCGKLDNLKESEHSKDVEKVLPSLKKTKNIRTSEFVLFFSFVPILTGLRYESLINTAVVINLIQWKSNSLIGTAFVEEVQILDEE